MSAYLSTLGALLTALVVYNVRMTLIAIAIALPIACVFAAARLSRHRLIHAPGHRLRQRAAQFAAA